MLKVKEIVMNLTLEDGILALDFEGKSEHAGKETYRYRNKEKGIEASVALEELSDVTAATVTVDIPNHPFRESFNLQEKSPVQLRVFFEEAPLRRCAIYQHRDWWSRPAFLTSCEELPSRTQYLLLEGDQYFGVILPMAGNKTKTYISGGTQAEVVFEMTAYTGGINKIEDYCFLLSRGSNLYEVSDRVMATACRLKKVPIKADREYPTMFEYFGWCSWDAFYTDITEEKVIDKVKELKEKQIPVRWILMDDGWLSTQNQCLADFKPDAQKFPREFKYLTDEIKENSEIDWIGVWHALGGYWGGVAPDSALAQTMSQQLYLTKNGKLLPHYDPEKGSLFWKEWYSYLRNQGINFVKVDGQSALKNYYKNNEEIAKVAAGTHQGLETAVNMLMDGNIINCMGMAIENVLSRPGTCISRNSDDFVPGEEHGFREHILQNTYNAMFHDAVYACDWDMYWTNHPDAGKHALVRAISGGPIYVSDRIGESVQQEIMPLVYQDGRVLRMDRCAMPTMDCMFESPLGKQVLKLTNTVNGTGAIAAFHISENKEPLIAKISPTDIHDLKGDTFGVYNYFQKTFHILSIGEVMELELSPKDYSLVLFLPIREHVTPIGLINKYMSAHAVRHIEESGKKTFITLPEGGIFGFHMENAPKHLVANGRDLSVGIQERQGFYTIDLSDFQGEVVVVIE